MTQTIAIPELDGDGAVPVYVARPAGTPRAAIIVIPEIFGVNPGIRQKCDHWAERGYLAAAPDIFWRFAPGVELDADVDEQLQEAFGYFAQFDADLGVKDIEALIRYLRAKEGTEKVGLVGYCLGGRMAYLAAARTDIDASVGYYGVMIDQMLNESHAIANPLILHIAGDDGFVPADAQKAIHEGLDTNHHVTLYDYPGLDHGFAAEMGNRRDEAGAQLADSRTEAFFVEQLG
ncbi:putative carboxymethylenebutenolidase [Caenibius tardaugens NBRC 16725]|uniref:Putative carboxymethylenebutenolidase n=1 Tax=Caenibius tardaugens NBRC 16725 TaxID=1219035 RepID=U2Y6X8_9SPHN|nr:dienelactone hydrolase family protein [Caenibius tardaugens]AZI36001.1 dienelactone hydrolase family protein [Caenibius tardaugens NBRC 16725]TXH16440.1 MAG: dienelactone hydrolase family protein [Gammaproteobacteria bacterium]GAD48936.1 putative carboxymethylenebutenolidase [Caenibius tardaugens NBRC 16725]